MRTGYLRQDESSHWYAIPEELIEEFDKLSDDINSEREGSEKWYELVDQFIDKFNDYRTGGGYGHIKILIEDNE